MKIRLPIIIGLIVLIIGSLAFGLMKAWPEEARNKNKYEDLITKAERYGAIRVIVKLKMPVYQPEGKLSKEAAEKQRTTIAHLQDKLLDSLVSYKVTSVKKFDAWIPYIVMEIDKDGLMVLISNPDISSIEEDVVSKGMGDSGVIKEKH